MNIALMAYLNTSGLSIAAQEYFKLFKSYKYNTIPVWLMPPEIKFKDKIGRKIADEMLEASTKPLDEFLQFHTGLVSSFAPLKNNSALLGCIVHEGNILTKEQAAVCYKLESIMSPSTFCINSFISSGISSKKLFFAPCPLDVNKWNSSISPLYGDNNTGKFKFLFMNTFYERKGWDVLLRAWLEEFSNDDPVELFIKSYKENDRDYSIEAVISQFAKKNGFNLSERASIQVIDEIIPSDILPNFMKSFDAYVSPHRSEGFGMNIWYSMAIGVPVICTNYGGCTDFVNNDTAWLFKKEKMAKPSSAELAIFPHLGNIVWAEPDIVDMRRQMRSCLLNSKERKIRADSGVKFVQDKYSYKNAIEAFRMATAKINPMLLELLEEY